MMLIKQKVKIEDQIVIQLLKFFNVPVPKGSGLVLDHTELKKPEFLGLVNTKLMQKLYRCLN